MNGELSFFYYMSHERGTYVDFHKHNCFELVYYVTGTGTMQLDGKTLAYEPGAMTLTWPNYLHDERHNEATDVVFFGFHYDDSPIRLDNGLVLDTPDREVLQLMHAMKSELLAQKQHYALRLNLMLNEVVLLLGRQTGVSERAGYPEKLAYARRFIDENYMQPVNLRTLAELSGYSDDHFRHLFKEQTGLPPAQYVIRCRLEAAKQSLLRSDASVSAIGMDCGFSTTSQFIELFKREHAMTPLQYRMRFGPKA